MNVWKSKLLKYLRRVPHNAHWVRTSWSGSLLAPCSLQCAGAGEAVWCRYWTVLGDEEGSGARREWGNPSVRVAGPFALTIPTSAVLRGEYLPSWKPTKLCKVASSTPLVLTGARAQKSAPPHESRSENPAVWEKTPSLLLSVLWGCWAAILW